jgi:hypothetical protein
MPSHPDNYNWAEEDKTVAQLLECKPLSEDEVKKTVREGSRNFDGGI